MKQFNCKCSDWIENGLKNVYIGCIEQDFQIQPFDYKSINIFLPYDRIELHFENKNFSLIENLKENDKVRRLRMRKSGIKTISNQNFVGMTNVEFIHLDLNQISLIEENSFENCSVLYEIDLSYNLITAVLAKTFSGAHKLLNLWLTGNKIKYIERNAFENLKSLKKISLSDNQVIFISAEFFKNLIGLEEVYVINNAISNIESDSFKFTKSLKK